MNVTVNSHPSFFRNYFAPRSCDHAVAFLGQVFLIEGGLAQHFEFAPHLVIAFGAVRIAPRVVIVGDGDGLLKVRIAPIWFLRSLRIRPSYIRADKGSDRARDSP